MRYIGDFNTGSTIRGLFNTRTAAGVPIALGGSPVLSVYKSNDTTQTTTGVSLTSNFDGVTGLHLFTVDTSDAFYVAGEDYRVVVTTGTVDSVSVVGHVVAVFSLANRSALRPTTAGRTLDVSSTGEAGIDLANVGSPTTTLNLSGTTISTSQAVASVTGSVGSVTGNVGGSVGSVTGNVGGTVATVTTLSNMPAIPNNWLTAAGIAAGALDNKGNWNIGKTGYALSAGGVQAIWDALTSALTTAGSIGKLLVDNINATISSRSTYAGADTAGTTTLLSRIVGTLATGTHNPQTGDSFARLGAPAGASIAADIAAISVGSGGLDAAGVRAAIGLASANLDTQLGDLPTNAEIATALGTADDATLAAIAAEAVKTAAIKAKTDNLPSDPADASDIATSFSTVASTLATIVGYIDTEIAAIKAKTDGLPADTAASLTALAGYVDTLETEVAKIIKTGQQFTATDGTGSKNVTFTRV